jgi:thiazole tautomerase (transcriptional regulator TenI)
LLVNDRVDVALAAGCGAQIGRRSIPVASARSLLGDRAPLGCSVHDTGGAVAAAAGGADFLVLGTIWPTPSHPGAGGAGLGTVADVAATVAVPVIVIGGVTPQRAREALDAGGHGVAVLRGVWAASDPVAAAAVYLEAMGARG